MRRSNKARALDALAALGGTFEDHNARAPRGYVFAATGTHWLPLVVDDWTTEAQAWAGLHKDFMDGLDECEAFAETILPGLSLTPCEACNDYEETGK